MVSNITDTPPDTGRLDGLKAGSLSPALAGGLVLSAFVPGIGVATQAAYMDPKSASLTWLALLTGTFAVLCVAIAVIVFARRYVVSGALYSYISKVFGRRASIVAAASVLFAYVLGILFIVVVGAIYLGTFLAGMGAAWASSPIGFTVLAIAISLVGGIVTHFGIDVSARLSITLLLITLPLVIIVTALLPFHAELDVASQFNIAGADVGAASFVGGVSIALAVMILFESSTATAVETRNPKRTLPWIVAGLPILLGVLYTTASIIQVPALPLVADQTAQGVSAISAFAGLAGVGWLGSWIDLSLAIAAVSAVIAFVNYGSRVAATMAQDGVLPVSLAHVHRRRGTPDRANVLVTALVVAFTIIAVIINGGDSYGVYNFTAALYSLFVVIPYVLICVAAVVQLRRERARTWPAVAITSLIGSVAFVWLLVSGFLTPATGVLASAPYVYVGTIVVSVGLLALYHSRAARRTAAQPTFESEVRAMSFKEEV